MIFDSRICALGEGLLWHPTRKQLFWFDIIGRRLLTTGMEWVFDNYVSAAGWVDDTTLIIASDTALLRFDIESGQHHILCPLEADNPLTRSNDGRADPWGGFWISTMGIESEADAGAVYRYYQGRLYLIYTAITIPNAICFSPDREFAYFTDTPTQKIMRQKLAQRDGSPLGPPQLWLDLSATDYVADGAVVDAQGNLWVAHWGSACVACYAPNATFLHAISFPAIQTSCPAFGGSDLTDMYCTSATTGMSKESLKSHPDSGKTFVAKDVANGRSEYPVIL